MKKLFSLLLAVAMILSIGSLALLAGAAYLPSVEYDDAPILVTPSISEDELPDDYDPNNEIKGIIIKGEAEKEFVYESDCDIISLSEAYAAIEDASCEASIVERSTKLIAANDALKKSVSGEISGIDEFAKALGFTAPKYSIENIFDLSIGKDLSADDDFVQFIFKNDMNVAKGSFIVAHYVDNAWVIVEDEKVVFEGDNIIVEFDELCPIVFLSAEETEKSGCDCDNGDCGCCDGCDCGCAEKSSKAWIWIVVIVSVLLIGGGVTVFILWKKGIISFEFLKKLKFWEKEAE